MRMIYSLIIILLQNWSFTWSQPGQVCNQLNLNNNIQIECVDVPTKSEWEKINYYSVTHQSIICAQMNKSRSFNQRFLNNLERLIFFRIEKCSIADLPKNFFENLIQLQNVILDNLPITMLRESLFLNSSNLVEVTMSRLKDLNYIHPRFLGHQNQLEKIILIESNFDPDQLRPVLLPIYNTLKILRWNKNKRKITLSTNYFQYFTFERLYLEYNGIDNLDFLKSLSTESLSLKGNPIGKSNLIFDWKNYRLLSSVLKSLDLSYTGIDQIFNNIGLGIKLPLLTQLILRNNYIELLPVKIEQFLPSLILLDIRNNKFTTLPSLDYMLRIKFGRVLVQGNAFHCNCEMKWIMIFEPKSMPNLNCQLANNTLQQPLLNKRAFKSKMTCIPPTIEFKPYDEFRNIDFSITSTNDSIKIYEIDMHPEEWINWRCVGEGDPAPRLKWVNNKQTLKVEEAPDNRFQLKTVMSNLIIYYRNLKNTTQLNTFVCKAKNLAGSSKILLKVSKKTKPRTPKESPVLGKIYQNDKNSFKQYRFSLKFILISIIISVLLF